MAKRDNPKAGEVWNHYKGNAYDILAVARHADDADNRRLDVVVYRDRRDNSKVFYNMMASFMMPEPGTAPDINSSDPDAVPTGSQIRYRFTKQEG